MGRWTRSWTGAPVVGASRPAALAIGVVAAAARHDLCRLDAMAEPAADDDPACRAARTCARASALELAGNPEAALDLLATVDEPALRDAGELGVLRAASRTRMHCLLLAGRPADAAVVARFALSDLGDEHLRHTLALTRWLAGDAGDFLLQLSQVEEYARASAAGTSRDRVLGAFLHASVAASWGEVSLPARRAAAAVSLPVAAPRDAAFLTNARAAVAVAAHREPEAAGCASTRCSRSTRRSPVRRSGTSAASSRSGTSSSHGCARSGILRSSGRRNGRPAKRPSCSSSSAKTAATLSPTSIPSWCSPAPAALVGRARDPTAAPRECPAGARLAAWLVDRVGAPVRAELRRLAAVEATAAGATALLAEVPVTPDP